MAGAFARVCNFTVRIDLFVFSESVACLVTVLHFVFFITHDVVKVAPIPITMSPPPPAQTPGGLAERYYSQFTLSFFLH